MSTTIESYKGDVLTFAHEPGNGTRYFGVLAQVSEDSFLVTWLSNGDNGGTAFLFNRNSVLHSDYVMEKMKLNHEADALALMVFLHEFTGVGAFIPDNFSHETGCWDGERKGVVLK